MKINWIAIALAAILVGILIWVIVCQIKEHHLQDDPMLHYLKQVMEPVHPIVKTLKLYKGDKSYTINKEKVFLCLKCNGDELCGLNHLVYVLTHEIAHVLNKKDVGHTEEFHRIFDELLARATEVGAFNPSIPIVTDYCGGS